ncbi:MAG: hypothetical protein ACXWPS_20095 [Ktedonobacteraceae bacterium]
MKHFKTIEKIDTGILYILEFVSSISVLLLAFGLIASMANVNTSLNRAYLHVHVPIEVLIWIRSLAIVLLIVVHALDHVQLEKTKNNPSDSLQLTPELISELQVLLTKIPLAETPSETVQIPQTTGMAETRETAETEQTQEIAGEGIVSRCDLLLTVSAEESNKVLDAYTKGIPRRDICRHLKWGSSKYTTETGA